jgi:hypothetical protein
MRPSCRSTACFLVFAIGMGSLHARDAVAQQANVFLRIDNSYHACQISIPPGVHTATVEVYGHPFQSLRFQAVVPAGAIFLGDTSTGFGIPVFGNSQTGVEVVLFGCATTYPFGSAVAVMTITFFAPAPLSNVTWEVQPFPGEPAIGLADCDNFPMKGTGKYSIYCDPGSMVGPYKPVPADGAVDVPLDQLLSFTGSANLMYLGLDPQFDDYNDVACQYYSTPPDPCLFPFDPGTLLPNTTYYWQAFNVCGGCEHGEYGASDVWSFTTADVTVSTQQSTWGRVKAMYRE